MIDLYTWSTPNGRKVAIMLEECGLDYGVHPIDISKDEQFAPDFLAISPNNKIPAIIDRETSISLFESGAILVYLADKTGRFLPKGGPERYATLAWLMFQMGGVGPMLGQAHHFLKFNPDKSDYAAKRYGDEAKRLYKVMDKQLATHEWLAGADYSIADIATWPWTVTRDWQGVDFADHPNVRRWYDAIRARPAVQRGFDTPRRGQEIPA